MKKQENRKFFDRDSIVRDGVSELLRAGTEWGCTIGDVLMDST
jgi:hypothetical protein